MHLPMNDPTTPPRTVFDLTAGPPLAPPALDREVTADVAVIGGGLVGCSAALHLAEMGLLRGAGRGQRDRLGVGRRSAGQVSASATKLDPKAVLRTYGPVFGPRLNAAGAGAPDFVAGLAAPARHGHSYRARRHPARRAAPRRRRRRCAARRSSGRRRARRWNTWIAARPPR